MIDARRKRPTATTLTAGALVLVVGAFALPACSSSLDAQSGPSCTNGLKDDGEDGLDCGGVCPTKCTGEVCMSNTECGSGSCTGNACAAPAGKPCGVGTPVPLCTDGQACELDKDCKSGFCDGAKCATPASESHSDGKKNSGETGVDCGGSVKATAPCPDGQMCVDSADCVGTCTAGLCGPIGPMDGKKNNGETDVDCGGANAPKCAVDKTCAADTDCADGYCPPGTLKCTLPRYDDGAKNGSETDTDCGGNVSATGFKKCAETKACLVDTDCNGACKDFAGTKKCIDAPSCKPHFGGDTCGTNEVGSGVESHLGPASAVMAGHESCCTSLEVKSFTDPVMPAGKTKVYLDKYEITAGRMRAFLEAVGGGVDAAGNAKSANVRAWMAAHRPNRWNNGWEEALPTANNNSSTTYTIKNATTNLLYPGQDQYLVNHFIQSTWWVGNASGAFGAGSSVDFTVDNGTFHALGAAHFFPEYWAKQPDWSEGPDYAASHALNCINTVGSYGYSTYWFDKATIVANTIAGPSDVVGGKYFSKDELDTKSLNCSPNALFAAFCSWDGGQLATADVIDKVSGNTVSPIYDAGSCQNGGCQAGKFAVAKSNCSGPAGPNTIITYSDGTQPCTNVYYYPETGATPATNLNGQFDGSSRIASPGRIIGDQMVATAGDEPFMDLLGNLQEVVIKKGAAETARFDYRGYGTEWGSIENHRNQQTTPRHKGGAFGARCMRFK
jgi:hypothetical protein